MGVVVKHPLQQHCPKCGAIPGQYCRGSRGKDRRAFHRERGSKRNDAPIAEVERDLTDSPIEHILLSAISEWIEHDGQEIEVITQAQIGPYRADVLIAGKLVVEADGKAFHNAPEAIQHDKRRDRFCAINGYAVMRFTGDEILRDPRGCAAEVGQWIRRHA